MFQRIARSLLVLPLLLAVPHSSGNEPAVVAIETVLDDWHAAAAAADEERYFGHFTADAVFMGTDATERWTLGEFREFARPYFERGRAWSFKAVKRFVVVRGEVAWFDEELDTPNLGPSRGSGTLLLDDGQWRIAHYNLSIPIPNEIADTVVDMVAGKMPASGSRPLDLDVMNFNIRSSDNDDSENKWLFRHKITFSMLRRQGSDIIGLQEPLIDQLQQLDEELPRYGRVGVGRRDGKEGGSFSAIAFDRERFEATDHGNFWLSKTPDVPSKRRGNKLPRVCTWVKLLDRHSGRSLYVYNVHLDHASQSSRTKSVRQLLEHIDANATDAPVIITGDFNAGEDNKIIRAILDRPETAAVRFVDTFRALLPDDTDVGSLHRFEGDPSGEKIDFIFASADVQVLGGEIVRYTEGGRYPSDHFPLTARLRFP